MENYLVTVAYETAEGFEYATKTFTTRQKDKQYVKEAYHRYVHENYGARVKRTREQLHEHPIENSYGKSSYDSLGCENNDIQMTIRLKDISPAESIEQL